MMASDTKSQRLKKVSVTIYKLTAEKDIQPELFDLLDTKENRAQHLSKALDKLNKKFGRDTVTMGIIPEQARKISSSKIAFTRIPDIQEFLE